MFNMTARVHQAPGETTSLGAAIAAGVGVGVFKGYSEAGEEIRARSTHQPNPQWRDAYAQLYPIYADIYAQIKPLNDRIAKFKVRE